MLKKIKLWQILIFIGLFITIVGVVLSFTFSNNSNTTTKKDTSNSEIMNLLKNDYIISLALYGNISVEQAKISINNLEYYAVSEKKINSLQNLQSLIVKTYDNTYVNKIYDDLDKYNKYIEFDNNLYVNINSVCEVSIFDEKIIINKNSADEISGENNGKNFVAKRDDSGSFKLANSVYRCI